MSSSTELDTADYFGAFPEGVPGYLDGLALVQRLNAAIDHARSRQHLSMHSRLLKARAKLDGYLADHEKDAAEEDRKLLGKTP